MAFDPATALPWLQLLDVVLAQVEQIRQNMNSGVPATKEQFAQLRAEWQVAHDQAVQDVTNMGPDNPPGTQLLG